MAAKKRSTSKSTAKRAPRKRPAIPKGPDPFRETIEIAHGDNPDGLADMTHAAHGIGRPATDDEVRRAAEVSSAAPAAGTAAGTEG